MTSIAVLNKIEDTCRRKSDMLDLSVCQLTSLPSSITQMTNLRVLGLAGNKLTQLPTALFKLVNLQELYLDGNPPNSAACYIQ